MQHGPCLQSIAACTQPHCSSSRLALLLLQFYELFYFSFVRYCASALPARETSTSACNSQEGAHAQSSNAQSIHEPKAVSRLLHSVHQWHSFRNACANCSILSRKEVPCSWQVLPAAAGSCSSRCKQQINVDPQSFGVPVAPSCCCSAAQPRVCSTWRTLALLDSEIIKPAPPPTAREHEWPSHIASAQDCEAVAAG